MRVQTFMLEYPGGQAFRSITIGEGERMVQRREAKKIRKKHGVIRYRLIPYPEPSDSPDSIPQLTSSDTSRNAGLGEFGEVRHARRRVRGHFLSRHSVPWRQALVAG